jgi:Phage integrase family/Phage integrase, N-terminal SAM-like domain
VTALNAMPAGLSSEQKLEWFLTDLARRRDLSANSQNQALNAVLYFYKEVLRQPLQGVDALRAKRPARLRHAPTIPETQALLKTIRDRAGYPTNLIARLIYGCGLRVAEPLNLRIKDLNLEQLELFLVGAKGGRDRVVSLPKSLVPELVQQMKFAQAIWPRDRQNKIPVTLPHQLAAKYPEYQFVWPWAWLFPAHNTCFHPAHTRKSAIECTRLMSSGPSETPGANLASRCFRMNFVTGTRPENCLVPFVTAAVCITADGKRRQLAANCQRQRNIATSSLPPFIAFCLSGFAPDFSSSQSLGDGVILLHSISASSNTLFFMAA